MSFVRPAAETDSVDSARVLVVDDDANIGDLLRRLLSKRGYTIDVVRDGPEALDAIRRQPPDVVLLDVVLPNARGHEICRQLKEDVSTRLLPVVLMTGMADQARRVEGLLAGADDFLAKPFELNELLARIGSLARLKRYTDDLDSAASIIMMLATMLEAREGAYRRGHCHRIANYATALGRRLSLGEHDLRTLQRGGLLHDVGMLAIPDAILRKPGQLTAEEFEEVKAHTTLGDALCSHLRSLAAARPIIRHHHERLDGSGYPDRLVGDEIPLGAQIIGIADVYDAVTTQRPYQHTRPSHAALDILRHHAEMGWRRLDLVEEFAAMIADAAAVTAPSRDRASLAGHPTIGQ
jgi:putative two-component system response regulator